ncbi:hypothetical protein [Clostridium akagii]|uniref:hypothetical protein n=1 Tax=Clostridium akagii TaxID=91623 RepID=UPI00047ED237|nr:hypothetical protein [Clostridium akagii]
MFNSVVDNSSKSIFTRNLLKVKFGFAIKECEKLKDYAKKNSDLTRDDYRYSLFISSEDGKSIKEKYFMFKGSHLDGRLKELKKFTYEGNMAKLIEGKIKLKTIAVDAFSKNMFMYEFREDDSYIYGKAIKKIKDKKYSSIVFMVTREDIKVHKKNVNSKIVFEYIDDLINKYGY